MQQAADHAVIARNDPYAALIDGSQHNLHSFAATADRLAAN